MTEFKPEKIELSQINGGNEYKNGDGIGAEAINAPIKASAYVQALTDRDNQPIVEYDGSGITTVVIEEDNGKPRFVFKNLNTARIPVDDALSMESENPVQNKVVTQALNEQKVTVDETLNSVSTNPVQNKAVTETINRAFSRIQELDTFKADDIDLKPIAKSGLLADAKEDETHRTVTDEEKKTWNGKQEKLTIASKVEIGNPNPVSSSAVYTAVESVTEVQRIDVSALYAQGDTDTAFAEKVTNAIDSAYQNRPNGSKRANIEFYNIVTANGTYNYWQYVQFASNCNYNFIELSYGAGLILTLSSLENCDFVGLRILGNANPVLTNCVNLQFINCEFESQMGDMFALSNCTDIYFENCIFLKGTYPAPTLKITDTDTAFHWIMLENCVFTKVSGLKVVDAGSVSNPKSLITISNCHYDDLSKVSKVDIVGGLGKISITASEDEIPTKVTDLTDHDKYATVLYVDEKASKVYRYCGSVYNYGALPTSGQQIGDTYNVENEYAGHQAGTNFAWNGTTWDALGGWVDLSVFVKKTDYATPTTNGVMLATDKAKLDSIENGANNYTLPTATGARLGGIVVGENLAVDENGILRGNYKNASSTQAGLMGENDKYYLTWLYSNLGKSYHAFGDVSWRPVEGASVMASVTYTRTGKGVGLLNISLTLNSVMQQPIEGVSGGWMVDITKVENLLSTAMNETIRFKRGVEGDTSTYYSSIGGTWVRQKEEIQTTHHAKARVCGISPFVIIPMRYSASATSETGISLGTVNASSFEPNETIQMLNIPVEEV